MRKVIAGLSFALALSALYGPPAEAHGCLKGAAVGAIAGHYAHHHAVLGAIGGCIVGRHMANEKARQEQAAKSHQHGATH
jgi:outer membrane lipoprotein SlyB